MPNPKPTAEDIVMKKTSLTVAMSVALTLGSLLGCSTPVPPAAPPAAEQPAVPDAPARTGVPSQFESPAPAPAPTPAPAAPQPTTQPSVATSTLPEHLDPASAISRERSVFFAFDESALQSAYTPLIERHGRYLAANTALAVRIEGNTDSRGGVEYNLALGQRRAESVARALGLLGVKQSQMEVVSYGEERPFAHGHTETAYAQNRRADIVYPKR
jgi:peptidoglycan-associated lipoprotein